MTAQTLERPAVTSGAVRAATVIARRTLQKFFRTPQVSVMGIVQTAMFLLLFRYVIGGAIATGSVGYADFLVPGFVATIVLFTGSAIAVGVAEDREQGFTDRLLSLPIPRLSVVSGRALADTAMNVWCILIAMVLGFAVGFRIHTGLGSTLLALALCFAFGIAFTFVFIAIGTFTPNAAGAQGISMLAFPLVFISGTYVPVSTMPGVLQPFARNQPVTVMAGAVRALTLDGRAHALLGQSTEWYVTRALAWTLGLVVVFGLLAAYQYGRSAR